MRGNRIFCHRRIYTGQFGAGVAGPPVCTTQILVDDRGRIREDTPASEVTERVELPGAAVVPGFIDTHAHLSSLGAGPTDLDLRDVASPEALLRRVEEAASRRAPEAWIAGTGWSDGRSWGGRLPRATELEAAAGGRPTALYRRDRHALLASTSALRLAGIDATTPDPRGGAIERDSTTGDPTGLLIDTAMDILAEALPDPTADEIAAEALEKAGQLAGLGVTCVHEAYVTPPLWEAMTRLLERRELPVRVRAILGPGWEEAPAAASADWLRPIGIKAFADGALGSRGAQLREPYRDRPTCGIAVQSDAELAERARLAERVGLQLAVHAIGDEALRRVLDLFEAHTGGDPGRFYRERRWRVEHAQMAHPSDMSRLGGVCLAVQPIHFVSDAPWTAQRLGTGRLLWSHRARSLIEAGAVLGLGSDFPIEDGDPLAGVAVAVGAGHPGVPEWDRSGEHLSRRQAFEGYWGGAAFLAFDERRQGRLLPGYLADFVCLAGDPFETERIEDLEVVATYVGGRRTFPPEVTEEQQSGTHID